MGHPSKVRRQLASAVAAMGLAGFGSRGARADLVIDVRGPLGEKTLAVTQGQMVVLRVFLQVSGTDGNNSNEWGKNAYGSFNSVGNLKLDALNTSGVYAPFGFNASGFQNGSIQDFDSDGDLDLGSAGTASDGKFFPRMSSPDSPIVDQQTDPDTGLLYRTARWATVDSNTSEIRMASLRLTVAGATGSAEVNFIPRRDQPGALWWEDTPTPSAGPSQHDGNDVAGYQPGSPVTIVVPEPAALGLMALGSLGLLKRRGARGKSG